MERVTDESFGESCTFIFSLGYFDYYVSFSLETSWIRVLFIEDFKACIFSENTDLEIFFVGDLTAVQCCC